MIIIFENTAKDKHQYVNFTSITWRQEYIRDINRQTYIMYSYVNPIKRRNIEYENVMKIIRGLFSNCD